MAKDPIDIHLGARLRLLRDRRKMTLQAVGREIGTTYQQVRKYESGDNRISAATLYRLAALLGVETAFFFEGLPGGGDDGERSKAEDRAPEAGDGLDEPMRSVLDRIEDTELRMHLAGLLKVLDMRGRGNRRGA